MKIPQKGKEVDRILVFGAAAHVGGPLARFMDRNAPDIGLTLATSRADKVAELKESFPSADVVVANYFDVESMIDALQGVTGIFIITPDFFDEITSMGRLVEAVRKSPSVNHIVRIAADTPGMSLDKLPRKLYEMGPGPAHQHFEAQTVLNASGLSVTHLNSCGYYMDDFIVHFAPPLREKKTLVIPFERKICFTDTDDLGEVGARLLIEGPSVHAHKYYDFNSGEAPRTFRSVAKLLSEVTGEHVAYDPDPESFLEMVGPALKEITGTDRAAQYFIVNWEMERDHQDAFYNSGFGEKILGRNPKTLEKWFLEHRELLL